MRLFRQVFYSFFLLVDTGLLVAGIVKYNPVCIGAAGFGVIFCIVMLLSTRKPKVFDG